MTFPGLDFEYSISLLFCLIPFFCFFLLSLKTSFKNDKIFVSSNNKSKLSTTNKIPKAYPLVGSYFEIKANKHRRSQWTCEIVNSLPNLTFTLHRPLGHIQVYTANPANVQHILKTHFHNYPKGDFAHMTNWDFMGDGIFNVDGEKWKFQRQVSSHEFNTKSLRRFVETVVADELNERLIPILSEAAANKTVLDFQDIFQRFAFDNICKVAFGYDPAYLLSSLPDAKFPVAFEDCTRLLSERINAPFPLYWKAKRFFNFGSEKQLKEAVAEVREFSKQIMREKKKELEKKSSIDSVDILSRFLTSGYCDEDLVTDVVISFILAGRDTTSAALTWFFWLLSRHSDVENEILREITEKAESPLFDEVKDMPYTHASLYETMRLYPPVPLDTKSAKNDDVLPDGTYVKKGTRVIYHPYAMGRVESVWGADWPEFRPERWLESVEPGKRSFVSRDQYTYPVFQAGPRVCLGKEMAMLQMKTVVAGILRRFKVVPVMEKGVEPVFLSFLTSKMQGGLPVRIEDRVVESC
ncbi:OLC1v1007096C1 [Oldenlandia corymbosa var. corymbosa]|uniref:OLC1v1007096C1 n=1 Tax=Oldenlandia corymbosa var. corymbosa TaxID=529605 RepID=A0AAV1DLV5_OLDCO|nr:OLC1v1007096C1 [Oldenlandia corymbosa var. corymbosa]